MWFRIHRPLADDAGGAGGGGGAGAGGGAGTKTYTEEEVAGLKASQQQLLDEVKKLKGMTKAYEGLDPEKARTALAALEDAERKKAEAQGNWQALEQQLKARHGEELGTRELRIQKLESALQRRAHSALDSELAKAGCLPQFMDLVKLEGQRFLRLKEMEEGFVEEVYDPETKTPLVADGQGRPMSVADLVTQRLKGKYPDAFQGSGSSGGGASKSAAGGGGAPKVIASTNSPEFLASVADVAAGKAKVAG
ncbi:MAG: hypothetical protein IPK12_23525 [Gemmatimonadetes bacterium]|nr:hypothetical protein [Gemmatimonadota bacterium]